MAPTPSFASLQYGMPYSIWQAIMTENHNSTAADRPLKITTHRDFFIIAPYKYSYLLTYLLTTLSLKLKCPFYAL